MQPVRCAAAARWWAAAVDRRWRATHHIDPTVVIGASGFEMMTTVSDDFASIDQLARFVLSTFGWIGGVSRIVAITEAWTKEVDADEDVDALDLNATADVDPDVATALMVNVIDVRRCAQFGLAGRVDLDEHGGEIVDWGWAAPLRESVVDWLLELLDSPPPADVLVAVESIGSTAADRLASIVALMSDLHDVPVRAAVHRRPTFTATARTGGDPWLLLGDR